MSEAINYLHEVPHGWEIVSINDTFSSISLNGIKIKQKSYLSTGKYAVVDQGQELIGGYYNDEKLIVNCDPPYVVFGDHTKAIKYITFRFIPGADGVKVLKPLNHINPKLFFYFLQCLKLPDKGYARHFQFINHAEFPLPPLAEQLRIVAKIEELLSDLDKGIETLKTAKEQLKVYRQAVLKYAFEGKLTNPDLEDEELPEGWVERRIDEIATVGTGATPLKGNKDYYRGGNIPWVTSGALNDEFVRKASDFVTEKAIKETNLSMYPKQTLLVAMYGEGKTRGKCSELLIDACTNQAIAAIYFENHDIRIKPFLKYFLLKNYSDIRKMAAGGVQPNLNLGIIKGTTFSMPLSWPEQNKIVQEIESRLSICDKIEASIEQGLQQAEALRQSILKKAFEGKLVQQDPNDEPAPVLLERIKSERAAVQPVKKQKRVKI